MSTIIYLLSALIVIFIISRLMKNNKIDAFTNMLSMLGIGLLLGAASFHFINNDKETEKTVVNVIASNPTQLSSHSPVVGSVCDTIDIVSQEKIIEGDTITFETEGLSKGLNNTDIIDDS